MASILEISPGGGKFFNVFEAAPENERDGPAQQLQPAQVSSVYAYRAKTTGNRVLFVTGVDIDWTSATDLDESDRGIRGRHEK